VERAGAEIDEAGREGEGGQREDGDGDPVDRERSVA
jgi:hypothetical protein